MTAPGSRIVVDVDRLLQARYLAAVAKELEALPVPVDAVVLNGPGRPGGRVVLRDQGATAGRPWPSSARWNGGRCWTLVFPGAGGRVRRHRLRRRRLPAPQEVAQFVARFAGERQPARATVVVAGAVTTPRTGRSSASVPAREPASTE
ncbi:hypothetical protein [Pseudonocardia cypriaca]|uniref:Uncharacterized protein n=1 Tax=Pseudonocardia cypriaca TaxID=882449 RepID=A0A543FSZ6_9PSEU|nr:hypothetical protein [Pseudonocardia cypriaca]TQM36913.1 hypothetical protein FB388_4103 [Pseudonocardia cypriaca]